MEHPAKLRTWSAVDHEVDDGEPDSLTADTGKGVYVGQVGDTVSVGHGAGEADHLAGADLVGSRDAPSRVELPLDDLPGAPASPVRLLGEETPQGLSIDAVELVVELHRPARLDHAPDDSGGPAVQRACDVV